MKSTSQGISILRMRVGHEEHRSLEHADEQEVAAAVVVADLRPELGDPALERVLVDEDLGNRGRELVYRARDRL